MMVNINTGEFVEEEVKASYEEYLKKLGYEKLATLGMRQGLEVEMSIERLGILVDAGLKLSESVKIMKEGPEKEKIYKKLGLYFHDLMVEEIKFLTSILDMK